MTQKKLLEDYYNLHKQLTTLKQQNSFLETIIFKLTSIIQSFSSENSTQWHVWETHGKMTQPHLGNDEIFKKTLTQEELKLVKEIHENILD